MLIAYLMCNSMFLFKLCFFYVCHGLKKKSVFVISVSDLLASVLAAEMRDAHQITLLPPLPALHSQCFHNQMALLH